MEEDDSQDEELTPIQKLIQKRKQEASTIPDVPDPGLLSKAKAIGTSALGSVSEFVKAHPTVQRLLTGEADGDAEANRQDILNSIGEHAKAKALEYETNTGNKVGKVAGPPIDDSFLPAAQHSPDESSLGYVAKGAYNQLIRPMASPSGMLAGAVPGKLGTEATENAVGSALKRGLPGEVTAPPVIKPQVIEPKLSQPSIESTSKIPPLEASAPPRPDVQPVADVPAQAPRISTDTNTGGGVPEFEPKRPVQKPNATELKTSKPNAVEEVIAKPNEIPKVESVGPEELKPVSVPGVPPINDLPVPGEARPKSKDVNWLRADFGSADKTLESRPESAPIAKTIIKANDDKLKWVATTERDFASTTKGLNNDQLNTVGKWLNEGVPIGQESTPLGLKTQIIKAKLDNIHAQLPEGIAPGGKNVGYIENYLTHIQKEGGDLGAGLKQIWEYHFKKPFDDLFPGNLGTSGKGYVADVTDTIGTPSSRFAEERTGDLKNIELNVNKVLPAYIESIARLKFDKQAVGQAEGMIANLPKSKLKDLATKYVANYSRLDAAPGLSAAWNDYTSRLMRTTSRSMLGFSTGLQTLHLARIPANLWPELGTKYTMQGIAKVVKNPLQAYSETAGLGMLSNEIRPWAFKTPMQKVDSVLNFMSAADFLDRSIGYHGFKQMYIDQGMNEAQATSKAIASSKRASLMTDPARPIMAANPDMSTFSGPMGKLAMQYKQVPMKIIEQYVQIAANAKQNPAAAARAIAGMGLTVAAAQAGVHTFHLSTSQFKLDAGGPAFREVARIAQKLYNGDAQGALADTAILMTPGGKSIKRQLEYGPSAFPH